MPGLISHYLFGEDCFKYLNRFYLKDIIKENYETFMFGAQGPNFFSYHRAWPFTKQVGIENLSSIIHTTKTNDFFKNILEFSREIDSLKALNGNEKFKNTMISYLCGYATHYILDRNLHPYVYNVEYKLINKYKNTKPQVLHKHIETDIDLRLINIIKNMSIKEFRDYTVFDISSDTLTILSDMYKYSIMETYSYTISKNEIVHAVNSAKSIRKFLFDPSRLRLSIVKNLEKVFNEKIQFSGIIYKNRYTYNFDVLNYQNNNWEDPFTNNTYTDSFIDLYNKSIPDAVEFMELIFSYINHDRDISNVLEFIGDVSYDTGRRCNFTFNEKNKRT
jgi:hypothetical protein